MSNKKFSLLNDKQKMAFVNSGNGNRLTKLQSAFKTKDWPIMIAIRENKMPSDVFGQLAFNHFKKYA